MPVMSCNRVLLPVRHHGHVGTATAALLLASGRLAMPSLADTLEVGPGKRFSRIEEANAQAHPGDVILVHPRAGGQPLERTQS